MLGLPSSTEISKQLPKKAIFAQFDLKPVQRDHFDEDIAKLTIVNVISQTTIPALRAGDNIECIYVLDVQLKKLDYDPKNIQLLCKLIPQKMVFALHFEDKIQLSAFHSKLLAGQWIDEQDCRLALEGLNLDTVWDNFIISIADVHVEEGRSLIEQIQQDGNREKLIKQISLLEAKMKNEKQSRKKLEYFEQLKKLRRELNK